MDELDKELEKRGHKFVRDADDSNIYVRSKCAGYIVLQSITKFLKEKLKLKVNQQKSDVDSSIKRKFLGYSYYYTKDGVKFRVHKKSYEHLKEKIRRITNRNTSRNFNYRLKKLKEIIVGWVNCYKLANMESKLRHIDV